MFSYDLGDWRLEIAMAILQYMYIPLKIIYIFLLFIKLNVNEEHSKFCYRLFDLVVPAREAARGMPCLL